MILNNSGARIDFRNGSGASAYFLELANSNADLQINDRTGAGAVVFTVKSGGNVGIGTTGPGTLLHVYKGSSGQSPTAAGLILESNTHQYLTMASVADKQQLISFNSGGQTGSIGFEGGTRGGLVQITVPITNAATGFDVSDASGNSRLRVLNGGNVGIGTTSPGYKLDVNGDFRVSSAGNAGVEIAWDVSNNRNRILSYDRTGSAYKDLFIDQNGTGTIFKNNGNVGIGTTSPGYKLQVYTGTANGYVNADGTWGSSSDLNLKKNISSVSSVLNNVLALNPVSYNFKTERNGTTPHIGFVAQEVEKLFPELVSTGPDGIKGISYAMFTPLLTKAIQQQQTQITGIADNQNKIVEQLTNQLSYQLADKTISIDTKINLIGASLDELNQEQYDQQIKKIKGQIEDNTGNLTLLDARLKLLETVLTLDSNNLKVIGDISANNLTLSGKLDVDSAVAGAFAVKVSADKPKTIGEAYICPAGFAGDACDTSDASSDGKSILVQTSAVSASAKIFVTPENDTNGSVWVEKKSDNSGFKIMLKPLTPILEKIKINWWIVEKISD